MCNLVSIKRIIIIIIIIINRTGLHQQYMDQRGALEAVVCITLISENWIHTYVYTLHKTDALQYNYIHKKSTTHGVSGRYQVVNNCINEILYFANYCKKMDINN